MPRPATRSARLEPSLRDVLLDSFGTVWNAYRQLDRARELSDGGVSYSMFARAMRLETVTPDDAGLVAAVWERRRRDPVAA